jgi:hypothetical protein
MARRRDRGIGRGRSLIAESAASFRGPQESAVRKHAPAPIGSRSPAAAGPELEAVLVIARADCSGCKRVEG